MSLFWRRGDIERAVLGELTVPEEMRLRVHLAGCESCRGYYDSLTLSVRALSGAPGSTRAEDRRELARLEAAMNLPPRETPRRATSSERPRRWLLITVALPVVAAVGVVLVPRILAPRLAGDARVTWRGKEDARAGSVRLMLYAKEKDSGTVRLVAELPGSGESHLSLGDVIQFRAVTTLPSAYVAVFGVDRSGEIHRYYPAPDDSPSPSARPGTVVTLGHGIELASGNRPGPQRIYGLFSEAPVNWDDVAKAGRSAASRLAAATRLELPGEQVSILVEVLP